MPKSKTKLDTEKYISSALKALKWLQTQLISDGSYNNIEIDLASYYKSPYLFHLAGKHTEANLILDYIKRKFMRKNGDFTTEGETKSGNSAFKEYWPYINGWIAITSQKMGRFDVSFPAYEYLKSFFNPDLGGFTTNKPFKQGNNVVDVLTTSHLGLTALYFGDLEKAKQSGNLLHRFFNKQPDSKSKIFLRMDGNSNLITDFPKEAAVFFNVSTMQPGQAYFMIGYPIAFLGKLYKATDDKEYLITAKNYLDFALACGKNIYSTHFNHKVGWGVAIITNITKDERYLDFSVSIADYLLTLQDQNGSWLMNEPSHTSFDQTAEIAIWLLEISSELSNL